LQKINLLKRIYNLQNVNTADFFNSDININVLLNYIKDINYKNGCHIATVYIHIYMHIYIHKNIHKQNTLRYISIY